MDVLNFENAAALLTACTGITYTAGYLEKILGQGAARDFKLNKKFGLKREDDTLPERFLKEPLTKGPTKGSVVNIKKMVDEYYGLHSRFQKA
jgi:aldehyde:ferredoxin oxidoreductase